MGYLKGRWSSLRGLSQQISDARSHQLAASWIESCLILHNLIIRFEGGINEEDPWYQLILEEGRAADEVALEADDPAEADLVPGGHETPGQRKRRELQEALNEALLDDTIE